MNSIQPDGPRRGLPRFTLRRLLLVTALVAIPLAWLANVWNRVQHQRAVVARIEAGGGNVRYNYQFGMDDEIAAPTDTNGSGTSYSETDDGRNQRTRVTAAGEVVEIEQPPGPRALRWLLGDDAFAHVDAVEFGWLSLTPPTSVDASLFLELPKLKAITLIGVPVTDNHVTTAAKAPHLRSLVLAGSEESKVSREAIESLATANELRSLRLSNEWLTDETVASVEKLTQLEMLGFSSSPQLTSEIFAHVGALTNLRELSVFRATGIDDQGTHHLRNLKDLRILFLQGTSISSETTTHVAGLHKLEWLTLSYSKVDDSGLRELTNLKNLSLLRLGYTNISDDGISALANFPELTHLTLGGTKITDAGLPTIGKLTQLESLELFPSEITDAGLIHLRSLKKLKSLTIGPHISIAAANRLRADLPDCRVSRFNKEGNASWPEYE